MWRWLAFGVVSLTACSASTDRASGAPAVVTRIDSELSAGQELDRLEVRALGDGATLFEQTYDVPGKITLPGTLTLAASGGQGSPPPGTFPPGTITATPVGGTVTLIVIGSLAGAPVVTRTVRFVMPSSQHALSVPLQRACSLVVCGSGQTCDQGSCVGEDIDATSLPGFGT